MSSDVQDQDNVQEVQERAFITRFIPGHGFKFEPIGDVPEREIFAMMDGAVRQISHSRLTAIENAVMQQSQIIKGLVAIIQGPPEDETPEVSDT